MKTTAQAGGNHPAPHRHVRISSRRSCFSLLATLLLATSGTALTATVDVDVSLSGGFAPYEVTIQPGDTVRWNWLDNSIEHTVTSGSGGVPDGLFQSGAPHAAPFTFSHTFPSAGTFDYFCVPHYEMGMTGIVHVGSTATPGALGNISTRLRVETGDNALIGGFIVTGTQPKRVIVRAPVNSFEF